MQSSRPFAIADPDWLAHRYVEGADAIRFFEVPRSDRGQMSFLTDANLGARPAREVPVATILQQVREPASLRWLFHSAFCGSTLLCHGLDVPGAVSSLSEPVILNDIVGMRRRGAVGPAVARVADAALRLLSRPYEGEGAVVVKPSNLLNPFAELLLALAPSAPAIFLYAPLDTFLLSVARKGLACRLWVRELLEGYLRADFVALGFEPADYFLLTDLQVAAVGWLAQHGHFARLSGTLAPGRLKLLDADRMMAEPREAMIAVAQHYGLGLAPERAAALADGAAFARHSKSGVAYSADQRAADYALSRDAYGEEIETVLAWADRVARGAGIALVPSGKLSLL